jgi:F-box and WD-40 domain protein CDC4
VLTRTLVGHESGVWGLCLVSNGGHKLVNTDKPKAKKTRTSGGKVDPSSKQKKFRRPSTQDAGLSSSQPSMRTLRAGLAGINLDSSKGMHVMPSESFDSLVPPAMMIALGLEALTDSEHDESGGDGSHREDERPGTEGKADSTKRRNNVRKGGAATSEEEDLPGIGIDQGRNKPSSVCFSSQGWGQPNSLIVSAGCDKVVRVWDAESG